MCCGKVREPVVKRGEGRNDAHGGYLGGDRAVVMGGIEVGLAEFLLSGPLWTSRF